MRCISPKVLAACCLACFLGPIAAPLHAKFPSQAESSADDAAEGSNGPWISSIAWLDSSTLVGTRSQGLLLRPASVVKAATTDLGNLQALGESESSLWSIVAMGGDRLLASDYQGGLAIYGGATPQKLDIQARWVRALAKSPQGDVGLAGTEDGKLIAIKLDDGTEVKRVEVGAAAIFDIEFNPAGDQIAVACGDGAIKLFSWPALESLGEMSHGKNAIWSLVYSNDGSQLISGGADRRLQLWDVANKRSLLTLTKTPDWVTSLVRIPDSSLVVAGCLNGVGVVADYQAWIPVAETQLSASGIWSMALSPDHKQLALGTRKDGIVIRSVDEWRVAGEQALSAFQAEAPPSPKE